jgi:hypothetical protein
VEQVFQWFASICRGIVPVFQLKAEKVYANKKQLKQLKYFIANSLGF